MIYNSHIDFFLSKPKLIYISPYRIVDDLGEGTLILRDMLGTMVERPVN